ncbi:peptide ABC transporter permease [Moraxella caviae]|uniref:Oligopeptide transport system permease protein OppC n=1 Tax=Moraxella caviae TaxID=34060 RepID=A0A1T0A6B1_9GAMM|nr:oligopeptide ABC transporter permease OppC [Moraxella caviae]OOR91200.1 peptide ABC transporter permease [Moraxella caviae]STZ13763.1 Oligopeptide transport system permease protein oppC [Moraxella caviae]VEW12668.1 Oligopeptide transport system permease protein oppC [Moraxella caviae]
MTTTTQITSTTNTHTDIKGRSLWQDAWRRFRRNKAALSSGVILLLITLFVLFAPMLAPYGYEQTDWGYMTGAPNFDNSHFFGTDSLGRDLLTRAAVGGRISLLVGVAGALVAVVIGTIYGAVSGYFGGKIDMVMMRFLEILSAFPFMFFVILLVTLFGRNLILIFVAIGMVSWLDVARIVRGQTLSLKKKEFIEAAHVGGVSSLKIVTRHIVPNVLGVVVVYASLLVPSMILFESFLSFLGLGVQEPMTSWGAMLQDGTQTMQIAPWILLVPAVFLVITLFCFNFIGDGLRDALDPKDR